jgi:hypothetical protein
VIDLTREKLIDLEEAATICDVTTKTIRMWMARTIRRLETVKLGGKRMTSREALQRFAQQADEGSAAVGVVLPHGSGPSSDYAAAVRGFEERHG